MENDQVFQAEADVEVVSRLRSRSSQRGHDTVQAAVGGLEIGTDHHSEDTPLLGKHSQGTGYGDERNDGPASSAARESWDGAHDHEGLPWYRTPSSYWLLPAFLVFTLAFGGTIVPKINLILSLICRRYCAERSMSDPGFTSLPIITGGENPQCQIPAVSARVSKFSLYMTLIAGLLSVVVSPKMGEVSDRYGRTRIICASSFGLFISEVVTILVASNPDTVAIEWLLLGAFFDGLGGSFTAAMALCYAYTSDCTAPDRRNVAFGYIHGCLFLGIALGPLIAGYIIKATGSILSIFYIAIAAHGFFLLWIFFIVPESLTKERQNAVRKEYHARTLAIQAEAEVDSLKGISTFFSRTLAFLKTINIFEPLSVLYPTSPGTNPALRRNLIFLAAVDTTMFGVAMGAMTIVILYSELMFGWGNFESSIFTSIVNTARVVVLIIFLPLATRLIRGPPSRSDVRQSGCDQIDLGIIRLAVLFDLMGYVGYATVRTGPLFILCGVLAASGGMGSPTLGASLTKHVPPDKTGAVLGAMGLLHAAARVVAPIIFNAIYFQTVGKYSQAVFVSLAACFGLAFIFSLFIRPHVYWDEIAKDNTASVNSPDEDAEDNHVPS